MQAIETKFVGPTNSRGARIIVKAQAGKLTVAWDHALSVDENHTAAAKAFAAKWEWAGTWVGGGKADGTGNVYVQFAAAEGEHVHHQGAFSVARGSK